MNLCVYQLGSEEIPSSFPSLQFFLTCKLFACKQSVEKFLIIILTMYMYVFVPCGVRCAVVLCCSAVLQKEAQRRTRQVFFAIPILQGLYQENNFLGGIYIN
jgi:hypothetical protein